MKRNVRLFSMLLALLCVFSMVPVMTVSAATIEDLEDYSDGTTTYKVVESVDNLHLCIDSSNNLTVNIILGADINYAGKTHKQINLNGKILDGNGYAIYGWSFSGSGNKGGFKESSAGGTVKNLTMGLPEKPMSMTGTTSGTCGIFLNAATGGTLSFENVTVYATLKTSGYNVGGFIGLVNNSATVSFKNCKFYGSMEDTGANNSGGFVGKTDHTATVTFENCFNYATVKNPGGGDTGGFVGSMISTSTVTIKNSANLGDVSANGAAGGIVGAVSSKSGVTLSIENSLNTGSISSSGGGAGGLLGAKGYDADTVTLMNSVNVGCVSSTSSNAGGLVSNSRKNLTIDKCGSFADINTETGKKGAIWANKNSDPTLKNGLFYTEIAGAADSAWLATKGTSKSLGDGIKWTNDLLGETFGKLIVNNAGTGAVLAAPTFAGVQEATNTAGKIRFVATLNDSLNYSAVGFKVKLKGGSTTITPTCNYVYNTLLTTDDDGFEAKVTAEELYGTYVFALAITGIPHGEGDSVTLQVTPYGKDLTDPTIEYARDTYEIVYTNGKVVDVYLYTA